MKKKRPFANPTDDLLAKAERSLVDQFNFLQLLIDTIPNPVFYKDANGVYLGCNKALEEFLGLPKDRIVGRTVFDTYPKELAEKYFKKDQELFDHPGTQVYEFVMDRRGVSREHFIFSKATFLDQDGRLAGLVGTMTNITERKLAEERLMNAVAKWRTTFDAIGDAICLLDRDGKILQCNQGMIKMAERPFPELIGHFCWEIFYRKFGLIKDCPIRCTWETRHRDTKSLSSGNHWFHLIVDPILDEAGEVSNAVILIVDVTEHQNALEQIKSLNLIFSIIKDTSEALLRLTSEPEMFQHICNMMLKISHIRFSWIGLVEPRSFEVKPVAWAGHEDGYLSGIKVTWDDSPYGCGPIGMAIKNGKPEIVEDIEKDPRFRPWRQQAQQRGYASCIAFPLVDEGNILGSLNVYSGKKIAFRAEELGFLEQMAGNIAIGIKSFRLQQELNQRALQLGAMIIQTIEAIASITELRDPYTAGHQRRVTRLALALAQEMGLASERTECLRVASLIHDIGKIVVPAEILSKPGKISDYEMSIIKIHPLAGYDILKKINFPWRAEQVLLQHHERLDGSGYPHGLKGSEISLEAKILAVADVVEAMASHRPYRPALGVDKALEEITKNKDILYDPEVVDACVRLFTEKEFKFE